MSENNSDLYGRSLERQIAIELANKNGFTLSQRAQRDNLRDLAKFNQLSAAHQAAYSHAAMKISQWLNQKYPNIINVVIDRLPDDGGNPTDICISHSTGNIQLSIKHNHDALKHPRPYALAQWLGFHKNSVEDKQHRDMMNLATECFRKTASSQGKFSDYASQVNILYRDVCDACVTTINSNKSLGGHLFESLVDPSGFHKIIVRTSKRGGQTKLSSLEVHDYYKFVTPKTVTASRKSWNTISLEFDNEWSIDLRVHTASSQISSKGQLSLKFDAQKTCGTIPVFKLV